MDEKILLLIVALYFVGLMLIARITSKKADNESFFMANKNSSWLLVAFGMVGVSLSGITFLSVPGKVTSDNFQYLQIVLGYLVGYFVVAFLLLPIFYKMKLVSIYGYLGDRYGKLGHKIGAFYFLLSRTIGASIRLLLVAKILQTFILDKLGVPFYITIIISILLIWLYTNKGGIKTIIWTDTLQTAFMLIAVISTIIYILSELNWTVSDAFQNIQQSQYSNVFVWEDFITNKNHFIKAFLGGMFITIGMTGLDQDMMQKNLTCRNTKEAQKNMISMSIVLVIVNIFFLALGALLYIYANKFGLTLPTENDNLRTDLVYGTIAINNIRGAVAIIFLLGLIAAAYSSADSALTSLTTSVCQDFLNIKSKTEDEQEKLRKKVHILTSVVLFFVILLIYQFVSASAIWQLLFFAGFTYGPLIGLFFFGIISKRKVKDIHALVVSIISPLLIATLYLFSITESWKTNIGYVFGVELILINAIVTYVLLFILSKPYLTHESQ